VGILGRDADYSGWLFQRSALINGAISQTQLVANTLNSAEYLLTYGTPSDTQFVLLLYQNVLRRTPSQAEMNAQLALLQSGTSRTQLAMNFLTSAEFQQNSGAKLNAFLAYACLLQRDAEQWERDFWANLMKHEHDGEPGIQRICDQPGVRHPAGLRGRAAPGGARYVSSAER